MSSQSSTPSLSFLGELQQKQASGLRPIGPKTPGGTLITCTDDRITQQPLVTNETPLRERVNNELKRKFAAQANQESEDGEKRARTNSRSISFGFTPQKQSNDEEMTLEELEPESSIVTTADKHDETANLNEDYQEQEVRNVKSTEELRDNSLTESTAMPVQNTEESLSLSNEQECKETVNAFDTVSVQLQSSPQTFNNRNDNAPLNLMDTTNVWEEEDVAFQSPNVDNKTEQEEALHSLSQETDKTPRMSMGIASPTSTTVGLINFDNSQSVVSASNTPFSKHSEVDAGDQTVFLFDQASSDVEDEFVAGITADDVGLLE